MVEVRITLQEIAATIAVITVLNSGIYWVFMKKDEETFDKRYTKKTYAEAEVKRLDSKIDATEIRLDAKIDENKKDFKEDVKDIKDMLKVFGEKLDKFVELFIRKN